MKKIAIFLIPATLLLVALVPTMSAFASAGEDVSCDPATGNPFQEKCDEKPILRDGYAKRLD